MLVLARFISMLSDHWTNYFFHLSEWNTLRRDKQEKSCLSWSNIRSRISLLDRRIILSKYKAPLPVSLSKHLTDGYVDSNLNLKICLKKKCYSKLHLLFSTVSKSFIKFVTWIYCTDSKMFLNWSSRSFVHHAGEHDHQHLFTQMWGALAAQVQPKANHFWMAFAFYGICVCPPAAQRPDSGAVAVVLLSVAWGVVVELHTSAEDTELPLCWAACSRPAGWPE